VVWEDGGGNPSSYPIFGLLATLATFTSVSATAEGLASDRPWGYQKSLMIIS